MTLLVAACSFRAARFAVEHWHYSRRMPMPPLVCFGVWEGGRYIGAVVFGRGANKDLFTPYNLDATQGAELVRVALREHAAPVSQIVAQAVRALRCNNPGLRLLISFADPVYGHHGGIYQALGWIYTGQCAPDTRYRDVSGRVYHSRLVSPSGWRTQYGKRTRVPKTGDLEKFKIPGKHRYLFPLDRAMRRKLAPLARPYPCGRSVEGDAPAILAGEAGSTPVDRSHLRTEEERRRYG